MHPRPRHALEALPPEARAAAEAAIARSAARRASPEGRTEEEEVIRKVREEFPPVAINPELAKALSALRAERERLGLSLSDVSERAGIDRATLPSNARENAQHVVRSPGPANASSGVRPVQGSSPGLAPGIPCTARPVRRRTIRELGALWALVDGDLLGGLDGAAVSQVGGNAGGREAMVALLLRIRVPTEISRPITVLATLVLRRVATIGDEEGANGLLTSYSGDW